MRWKEYLRATVSCSSCFLGYVFLLVSRIEEQGKKNSLLLMFCAYVVVVFFFFFYNDAGRRLQIQRQMMQMQMQI